MLFSQRPHQGTSPHHPTLVIPHRPLRLRAWTLLLLLWVPPLLPYPPAPPPLPPPPRPLRPRVPSLSSPRHLHCCRTLQSCISSSQHCRQPFRWTMAVWTWPSSMRVSAQTNHRIISIRPRPHFMTNSVCHEISICIDNVKYVPLWDF